MSEREYQLDVCPECKVREGNSSEKKLFQCRYCERWFCEKHLEPRVAAIRDLKTRLKDADWREVVERDWKRSDGHPDYAYTWKRLSEVRAERHASLERLKSSFKSLRYESINHEEPKTPMVEEIKKEEANHTLGVCRECIVKEQDSSEKKLYQCEYCEQWFCDKHVGLRVVQIPNFKEIVKDRRGRAWKIIAQKDRMRNDGHPDFDYTLEKWNELGIQDTVIRNRLYEFLGKSRAYRRISPQEPMILEHLIICPKCGSTKTMTTAYREEFEALECLSCHYKWKEVKGPRSEMYEIPISEEIENEKKLSFVKEERPYELFPVQPKTRSHKVRNAVIVISFLTVLLIGFALFSGLIKLNLSLLSSQPKPEINMRQKILDELPDGYSIQESDWVVWSRTFRDSGGIFTKMDTWEQFKESYRQNRLLVLFIGLDQQNRVVWIRPAWNQVIYYEY